MIALFTFVRALHFASLMMVFGASALLFQARRIDAGGEALWRPLFFGALTALVTAVLSLCLVTGEMVGDPTYALDWTSVTTVVAQTYYGHVFLVRFALLTGLCLVAAVRGAHLFKALVAGVALMLPALTSHAAAAGAPQYALARAANDALHLVAAGFWVGGLAVIAPQALPRPRNPATLAALLGLFSRWGVVSVAVLLAAGTVNAIAILYVPGMHWSTAYITWLAVKIVLAFVMVALALTNRFAVLPALLRREKEAEETIPLTIAAELSCAVLILLIVGFLGLTAPMEM